jgi:hypothetical protein
LSVTSISGVKALLLQQFAHQLNGSGRVAATLHEQVENLALAIHVGDKSNNRVT